MKTKLTACATVETDHDYATFERLIRERVAAASGPLFQTSVSEDVLFDAYLRHFPLESRQHYNCRCCRRFLSKYGGLVTLDAAGDPQTVLWSTKDVPDFFRDSVFELQRQVLREEVVGVFLDSEKTWGTPQSAISHGGQITHIWTHLSGTPPTVFTNPLKTAFQAMAEKKVDYATLRRGLSEFPLEATVQAVRVLEADAVDRSEKTLGMAKWLLELQRSLAARPKLRDQYNLVWRAVATAPPGWCHIRSTMIATLLEDIIAGMPFEAIAKRWADKMHPLQYQRPTAQLNNIKAANEIVARLGSAGALQRRFAKRSDILATVWKPREVPPVEAAKHKGAFDHLLPKTGVPEVQLPAQKMAWEKFRDTVLPQAFQIECRVPVRGPYYGLVTAADPDAPVILQWDGLADIVQPLPRNPVSWYFYHDHSAASDWSLTGWQWCEVGSIHLKPCHWQKPDQFVHQGQGVFLTLPAAQDRRHTAGGGFFPECLRAEYHAIRGAMEAHAQSAPIAGREEGDANGIALAPAPLLVRVQTVGTASKTEYLLTL